MSEDEKKTAEQRIADLEAFRDTVTSMFPEIARVHEDRLRASAPKEEISKELMDKIMAPLPDKSGG